MFVSHSVSLPISNSTPYPSQQSQVDVVGADRQQLADLASLLCATLQSLLRKISPDDAKQISDMVMRAIYLMLNSKSAQTGGVQEDAIMTVGVLVEGESCDSHVISKKCL